MTEYTLQALLTTCDREPIHIPGAIQPHGVMLVIEPADGRLVASGGDVMGLLGEEIRSDLPQHLLGILRDDFLTGVPAVGPALLNTMQASGRELQIVAHRSGDLIVLELEPAVSLLSAAEALGSAQLLSSQLESAQSFQEVCHAAAAAIFDVTGYDRVLVYRFLEDGSGVVVAEAANDSLPSLLHHHFPESDIPRQARELYARNLVRVIPNARYTPAPLIWLSGATPAEPLDMSNCHLRSVSPVHLQYLRNMSVDASASISLMIDNKLWGLVTCHNSAPRHLDFVQRELCKHVGQIVSAQIASRLRSAAQMESVALGQRTADLLPVLSSIVSIEESMTLHAEELMGVIPCDGAIVHSGQEITTAGSVPPANVLVSLLAWIEQAAIGEPFSTHRLGTHYDPAISFASAAAGALSTTIRLEPRLTVTWLRAERLQTIDWAGNPHKDQAEPTGELSPRTSFELWRQFVDGEARPWSRAEVTAAANFRLAILEIADRQKLTALNRELRQALTDREELLAQKDMLMREVHHRVQNSLQLVNAMLALQGRSTDNEEVRTQFDLARQRLTAVAMVHKRLWRTDKLGDVRFDSFMTELLDELTSIWGSDWERFINLHVAPVTLTTDKTVTIGLIMTELLTNAVKYAYDGAAGPLLIEATERGETLQIVIADRGKGRAPTAKRSFGSRLIESLTLQLGGSLEMEDNNPGLRVVLEIP